MQIYQPSWVDLAIVAILFLGMVRGKKRGMSEELLDVIKWIIVVVAGAYLYEPLGGYLADVTPFSLLSCFITVYSLIILSVVLVFGSIKQAVGEKILESDAFGDAEYYLGIVAGFVRYACVLLVVMSLIHARHYTADEIAQNRKVQMDNFGMVFYTLYEFQGDVFNESILGRSTKDYLSPYLIRSTSPEQKSLGRNGVRAREQFLHEVLE
jgi:uncharacterized membrane protein required for colicin V production